VLDCPDILISLAPAYTRAILEGRKTVELRRRRIHVGNGTRVWLYSKAPTARIEGTACVQRIYEAHPKGLWSKYSDAVGISKAEFDSYFQGCIKGCAIVLGGARAILPALDLATMRNKVVGFHPPQFFKRLDAKEVNALLQTSAVQPLSGPAHSSQRSRLLTRRGANLDQVQFPGAFSDRSETSTSRCD
jgi:predicted transcriptional regulator